MVRKMAVAMLVAGAVAAASRPAVAQAMAGAGNQAQTQMLMAPAAPVMAPAAVAPGAAVTPPAVAAPAGAVAGASAPTQESAVVRYGPSLAGAKLLMPVSAGADQPRLAHVPVYRHQPGVALMIVGGALFLGGAIVGDTAGDALMVGGVVVAAIGLYQFLE